MKKLSRTVIVIGLVLGLVLPAMSQDLEETLNKLVSANAKGYLSPAVTAFGIGMNSGVFHTAKPHKLLGFDFKISVSAISIPESAQTFDFIIDGTVPLSVPVAGTNYNIDVDLSTIYEEDRTSATLFGDDEERIIEVDPTSARNEVIAALATASGLDEATIAAQAGAAIDEAIGTIPDLETPPGIINLSFVPMVVPQFSIGLPLDIELSARGFPPYEIIDGMGKLGMIGFGGKIGLNQFIPMASVPMFPKIAVGYYYTNLAFGDILKFNNNIMSVQISETLPIITVYAGLGWEFSNMKVSYDNPDYGKIEFDLDGDNGFRSTFGVRLKLAILSINADYNLCEYPAFNLGLGLTLR